MPDKDLVAEKLCALRSECALLKASEDCEKVYNFSNSGGCVAKTVFYSNENSKKAHSEFDKSLSNLFLAINENQE